MLGNEIFLGQRKGRERTYRILENLRGEVTILLPLRIFSWVFLAAWLFYALPIFDTIFLNTQWYFHMDYQGIETWFGKLSSKSADMYYIKTMVTTIGMKGFILVKETSKILSDTSLEVTPRGNLVPRKRLRF